MTGKRLGHFEILEQLGEGGMGVVYKARDTHLDRFVAVKVLRSERMGDVERKRRFVQEAKAASALNHPNIITVHDVAQEDGTDFLVMELVSGKMLGQLIGGRPMPIRETLRLAVQVADALAAAHGAGIVHRDLKPANLMVNDRGALKVLDFGLAKLREAQAPGPDGATRTAMADEGPATEEGTILGTVAYMAPEQAEGRAVDARADIFSFGVVLYEMVTGQRPFQGETRLSTLSAILKEEPKSISALRPEVPPELDRIITRCLRKDPARRFQHMDDLKVALEESKEESDSGKLEAPKPAAVRRDWRWPAVAAGVGILLVAGAVYWKSRPAATAEGETVLTRLTVDSGLTTQPALSPDGKLVAYASDRAGDGGLDIYVQQIAGGEPHRLTTHAADDSEPSFSPDSSRIAFSSERDGGGIFVVSTLGGTERKIAGRGLRPRYSPDGATVAFWTGDRAYSAATVYSEVYLAAADGGKVEKLNTEVVATGVPVWSPDGRALLVAGRIRGDPETSQDWFVVSMGGKEAVRTGAAEMLRANKLLLQTTTNADYVRPIPHAWTAEGIVFSAPLGDAVNIWEAPIESDFRMTRKPRRLTSGTGLEGGVSVAHAGGKRRMAFSSTIANTDIWSLPFSTDQPSSGLQPNRVTSNVAEDIRPTITADGRLMTFNSNRAGNWDIWALDLASGKELQVTSSPANEENPRVSPDGSRIAYRVVIDNKQTGFLIPSSGGLARQFVQGCTPFPFAADSRHILCTGAEGLQLVDVDSGGRTNIVARDGYGAATRLSWDMKWVVSYQRMQNSPGRARILVTPVDFSKTASAKNVIEVTNGDFNDILPEFSPNGKLIYFISNRDSFHCFWVIRFDPAAGKTVGEPFAVHHFHSARRSPGFVRGGQRAISIARDKIVFTTQELTGNIWLSETAAP